LKRQLRWRSSLKKYTTVNSEKDLGVIIDLLQKANRFIVVTHKDPDADGIGSVLALGKTLSDSGKTTVCMTDGPLQGSLGLLRGAGEIRFNSDGGSTYDATLALDCSSLDRIACCEGRIHRPLVNIDHHDTNDLFGDLNFVDKESSSTGELVFRLIKRAGFPICYDTADNIFAAIQSDTGSFKYTNTTPASLQAAMELIAMGVKPWDVAMRVMDGCQQSRLELLRMGLGSIRFYHQGRIGVMVLTSKMFQEAGADFRESERFVDYPRSVRGVEIAVLVRQTGEDAFKFSLRSNSTDGVAELASLFGGGGHARAAAFELKGSLDIILGNFLKEAERFLDG
jgi:phosphoesterase RecJ-like protein